VIDNWTLYAACKGMDPNRFHQHRNATYTRERRVCGQCPVRIDCLKYALDNRITVGLYGGLLPEDRERVLLKRRRARAARRAS
jgi:WhiB family redox-sensing transcriptional regulator